MILNEVPFGIVVLARLLLENFCIELAVLPTYFLNRMKNAKLTKFILSVISYVVDLTGLCYSIIMKAHEIFLMGEK
jgi:hypothetical protein